MRGVVFTGERELELMDFPDPTPGPGEVVIEMKASGMCGSDLHQYRRPKGQGASRSAACRSQPESGDRRPRAVRHRRRGRARRVASARRKIGQRVMVHHYKGCTVCNHCRSGWSQLCQEVPVKVYGNNAHGGHAQIPEGAGLHAGAAARRTVVRSRRGDLLRHRHRLRRAAAHAAVRQRHDRDLRPGAGRAVGDAARQGDGRARHRARRQPASGWSAPRSSAPTRWSTRARTIRSARSRI